METLIEKDVRVGQYDPALTSETFQFEDEFSLEAVERMYQQIQEDHDLNLPQGFIEKTDKDPFLVYSDTDSAYLIFKLPFNKREDIQRTVKYCQNMTIRMNEVYRKAMDFYIYRLGNWHPDFNTMQFKSEVIAFKGFFGAKKFYALGKIWDEGVFYEKIKLKITGGQLKKADVTKVTKEMLTEIYNLLAINLEANDEYKIYNDIFVTIKNKYIIKLKEAIDNLDLEYFTIPKKWSFGEKKNIPAPITGARLYNRLIKDVFNVGDGVLVLPIKYNIKVLHNEFNKQTNVNENMLSNQEFSSKIKNISIPPRLNAQDKAFLIQRMKELEITIDRDQIFQFNIDMKLEPYKKLFSMDIVRGINNPNITN